MTHRPINVRQGLDLGPLPRTPAGLARLIGALEVAVEAAADAVDRAPDDPNLIILRATLKPLREARDYDREAAAWQISTDGVTDKQQ